MRAERHDRKIRAQDGLDRGIREYIKDVRVELSKVTWPTRDELRESTIVVIVMVFS